MKGAGWWIWTNGYPEIMQSLAGMANISRPKFRSKIPMIRIRQQLRRPSKATVRGKTLVISAD